MLDTKNGAIDVDELVNTLLKDKQEQPAPTPVAEAAVAVTAPEPSNEPEKLPDAESAYVPLGGKATAVSSVAADETDEMPTEKPRKGLFGWLHRREEDEPLEEEWADWGIKPIGADRDHTAVDLLDEPAEIAEPDPLRETPLDESETSSVGRENEAADVSETVAVEVNKPMPTVEPATMVIPAVDSPVTAGAVTPAPAIVPAAETPEEGAAPLPNQVSLEELVRIEDIDGDEPAADEAEDPEAALQRAREEKVKGFVLDGDEEEENEPDEEEVVQEDDEPELEDFTGYDTTEAVRLEMQYQRRAGLIGLVLTIGLELLLLVLTLVTLRIDQSPITAIGYLTVHIFALVLMAVLNYSSIAHGLSGLFTLRANNDSAPAVAMAVALCGVIIHFLNMDIVLPAFAPLAGLLLVFNAIGRQIKLGRIWDNFAFVSYQGDKYSAALIEDGKTVTEFSRHAMADGMTNIAYFRRSPFLSSYLNNATDEDDGGQFTVIGMPIACGLSLALSLVLLAVGRFDSFWSWMSGFVFMLCLSAFTLTVAMQLPMRQLCRRMLCRGGFLVGWNAVEAFGRPDALVVDVADLYADEAMLLHGIKTFSGMHIDAAILDAASLSIRAGGPLSLVFRRIIENKEELLREVDSLTYEQGMGLSGWVDGRRVLVGNRRLLQNHDVDVPSLDYEARYAKNGRRLVYLSTSGVLSAMFVVSYLPDESIADALRGLCRSRVTLLVRSNDANITAESLCADFDLDEYYVDVLPATVGRLYDRLVVDEAVDTPALMASNGHILGTSLVMAACRSLRIKSYLALTARIVSAAAGLALCALWASADIGSYLLPACGAMLGAGVLSWLLPLFKR